MPRIVLPTLVLAFALACRPDTGARPPSPGTEASTQAPSPSAPAPQPPARTADARPDAAAEAADPVGRALDAAAARYADIAREGDWPTLPAGTSLAPGDSDPVVRDLRELLTLTGDLDARDQPSTPSPADVPGSGSPAGSPPAGPPAEVYDAAVAEAVGSFQERHGLDADGVVGPDTVAATALGPAERAEALRQTSHQWRTLEDASDRMILVNTSEYLLRAFEDGRQVEEMKVVVGAEYDDRSTPTFHEELRYVVFGPYWNVPESIASEELLPKGAEQLAADGFEVVVGSYEGEGHTPSAELLDQVAAGEAFLRQAPGTDNPLGQVKFIFPNQHAVYLHDTPEDALFERAVRAFSHGCIRVEEPAALAAWLLEPQDWTPGEVEIAMEEGHNREIDVGDPVSVHIVAWPAFADADGEVRFARELFLPA